MGLAAKAQPRVVFFTDKANNSYSLSRPNEFLKQRAIKRRQLMGIPLQEKDLPVSGVYLDSIRRQGASIRYSLKWPNAAVIDIAESNVSRINSLGFVRRVTGPSLARNNSKSILSNPIFQPKSCAEGPADFGQYAPYVDSSGADSLIRLTRGADKMLIAVLDGGFRRTNQHVAFRHLFANQQVDTTWDVVSWSRGVYVTGTHGTNVLTMLAAKDSSYLIAPGFGAHYALIRTEDESTETPVEMYNLIKGLEIADEIGSDVVNGSLGYNTFDDVSFDIPISGINGRSVLSQAANYAVATGMICVFSAGNDGLNTQRNGLVSVPADADSVLSIGSIDSRYNLAPSSSRGPTADGRIKPDLIGFGSGVMVADASSSSNYRIASGTSFASPWVAGLAAVAKQFLQRIDSSLTAKQVQELLKSTAFPLGMPVPNNEFGYGLVRLSQLAIRANVGEPSKKIPSQPLILYPNPNRGSLYWSLGSLSQTEGQEELTLYNSLGLAVLQIPITEVQGSISLASLPKAVYFWTTRQHGKGVLALE